MAPLGDPLATRGASRHIECAMQVRHLVRAPGFQLLGLLGATLALYVVSLPSTVQGFDTGELVAKAWRFEVAHPPGFPLYIWFYGTFLRAFYAKTVFWRASLCTALLSVGTLATLAWPRDQARNRASIRWLGFAGCAVPLAISRLFWSNAVLPDVFALNACLASLFVACYLHLPPGRRRSQAMCGLAGLGLCNHPTFVFLLPLLWDAARGREDRIGKWIGATSAFAMVGAFYASIVMMNPSAFGSWGNVDGLYEVVRHAVRAEYGILQLDGHATQASLAGNLEALGRALFPSTPLAVVVIMAHAAIALAQAPKLRSAVAAVSALCIATPLPYAFAAIICAYIACFGPARQRERGACLGFTLLLHCLVFCRLANMGDGEMLQRFYLLPAVLCTQLGIFLLGRPIFQLDARIAHLGGLVAVVGALSQLPHLWPAVLLADETIAEDYAINLLNTAAGTSNTIVVTDSDSAYYASRYVQDVLHVHPELLVLPMGMLFDPVVLAKAKRLAPKITLAVDTYTASAPRQFFRHFVEPNLNHYRFLLDAPVRFSRCKTTFKGLGRLFEFGSGEKVDSSSLSFLQFRSDPSRYPPGGAYIEIKRLYGNYAWYYLAAAHLSTDLKLRRNILQACAERVPYCFLARRAACQNSEQQDECMQRVAFDAAGEANYYPDLTLP